MNKKVYYILFFFAIISLSACNRTPEPKEMVTSIFGVNDSTWVYYSLESGDVVGTSRLLSEQEDAKWAERKDWDFAICGELFRTNGGTSGKGKGGVFPMEDETYLSIKKAPLEGYLFDSDDVIVKVD